MHLSVPRRGPPIPNAPPTAVQRLKPRFPPVCLHTEARAHRYDPWAPHLGLPPRLPSPQRLPPLRGDATLIRPPTCGAGLVAQVVDWGVDKRKPPPDEPEVKLGCVSERRNHIDLPAWMGNRRGHKLTRGINHTAALMDQAATRATHRVGALVTHRIVASNRQTAFHQLKLTTIERYSPDVRRVVRNHAQLFARDHNTAHSTNTNTATIENNVSVAMSTFAELTRRDSNTNRDTHASAATSVAGSAPVD